MSKAKLPLRIYILIVLFLCHLLSVTYESDLYGNIFSPIVAFYSSYVIYSSVKKFQLLTDITGIGIILMILIWSFIFSKTSMRYESSFDFINTTVYMLSDFIVLASYIVFYFSARKKKTPISPRCHRDNLGKANWIRKKQQNEKESTSVFILLSDSFSNMWKSVPK